jgi:DNA-binding MarR family transcriptional regulator
MSRNNTGAEALAVAMASPVNDAGDDALSAQRLKILAQSLRAMAQELEAPLKLARDVHAPTARPNKVPADLSELALQAYRDRRRRSTIFGDDALFGEPAWDILLDLFVAGEKNRRVAVTSACIGSGVPSTTALRWLSVLETRGLIEREYDDQDARRSFVRLTPQGRAHMVEYLTGGQN